MILYAKQPNGKYCRFSSIVDALTHYNMSESELIEMLTSTNYKGFAANMQFDQTKCLNDIANDIANPTIDGHYLVSFKTCMRNVYACNSGGIDELRADLKQMGYANWERFESIDYMENKAYEELVYNEFDKVKDVLGVYLHKLHENSYFIEWLNSHGNSAESFIIDVNNISTSQDFVQLHQTYISDYISISSIIQECPGLWKLVDCSKFDSVFDSQFK